MIESRELCLYPIGRVTRGRPWPPGDEPWENREAEIELDPEWIEALDGLEDFTHAWIVWWLDRALPDGSPLPCHIHPENRPELPEVGLFATRTPRRPNPIAITAVRLLERVGARLRVLGLDACQDTPVLDIKPYLPRGDSIAEAAVPSWLEELWRVPDREQRA
jgi:tRNA-Thr(GGU) m(6)t(6)A37 methyltransferase TsaA